MLKDSVTGQALISALNGFLSEKEKPNKDNAFVRNEDLPDASILLDEIKGMEESRQYNNPDFYKPYLDNIVPLNDSGFLVQFSYRGVADSASLLKASFSLLAKKTGKGIYFSSPLKQNTVAWKGQQIGSYMFYFKNKLNAGKASEYVKTISLFDTKLGMKSLPTSYYCCDNFPEALQIIGVAYKADYSGISHNTMNAVENNQILMVDGVTTSSFTEYDPHDLWHSRLRRAVDGNIINRPVDEGCAYLYGGSWGISWPAILRSFKEKLSANPGADWLTLYETSYDFGDSKEKPLLAGYVINALIIQKLEREKGFGAIMELLKCGKHEPGNEHYFRVLDKLTGINKANFNTRVWALIRAS